MIGVALCLQCERIPDFVSDVESLFVAVVAVSVAVRRPETKGFRRFLAKPNLTLANRESRLFTERRTEGCLFELTNLLTDVGF